MAMAHMMHLGENLTAKDVGSLAGQPGEVGDKARAIWRSMGEALGIALATLVNTFNFPLYLLSGAHGLHLVGGVLALLAIALRRQVSRIPVESVAIYWHFMDGLWLYILAVLFYWR